jgi:hypothetical protein
MSFTREQWAYDLLAGLGNFIPNLATVDFVAGWSTAETVANSGARFNLLNTTQPAADATDFNSVHVKNYSSYLEGIQKTVETLNNGYYPNLSRALTRNDNTALAGPSAAILKELNTWCGSCGYGAGFLSLGANHLNDIFNYGSAPTKEKPMPQAPTSTQIHAANDSWHSVRQDVRIGTGIYDQWLAALVAGNFYGPPVSQEYSTIDWNGEAIVAQEFAHARAEWRNGLLGWYGPSGKLG